LSGNTIIIFKLEAFYFLIVFDIFSTHRRERSYSEEGLTPCTPFGGFPIFATWGFIYFGIFEEKLDFSWAGRCFHVWILALTTLVQTEGVEIDMLLLDKNGRRTFSSISSCFV